jgi:hypothetical protein
MDCFTSSKRPQNEGPKNELDDCTVRFIAAQLPTGSILTSVACGPDSPRPKDCPGLGDPNTLKLGVDAHGSFHFIKASSILFSSAFVTDPHNTTKNRPLPKKARRQKKDRRQNKFRRKKIDVKKIVLTSESFF